MLLGALAAAIIAAYARRAHALSRSGQWGAFAAGTAAAVAGWGWAALLVAYFVVSSALTRVGRAEKRVASRGILPVREARTALQVAANGVLFVLLVLLGELHGEPLLLAAGLGALAASAGDTWATEVGMLWGGTPRSIVSARPVTPGESGGVTLAGLGASAVAGLAFAAAALLLVPHAALASPPHAPARMLPTTALIVAIGLAALLGSLGDSLLGATLQSKRWCPHCRMWTERRVHTCKYRTQHAQGVRWMTNDTVNFLATVVGALVAVTVLGLFA